MGVLGIGCEGMGYWVWVKTGIIIVPFFQIYRENEEKIASGSDFLSEPGLWIAPNPE
jgi:hypothetical protein